MEISLNLKVFRELADGTRSHFYQQSILVNDDVKSKDHKPTIFKDIANYQIPECTSLFPHLLSNLEQINLCTPISTI